MAISIDKIEAGTKFVVGAVGGLATSEFVGEIAEIVFDKSQKEIFKNPTVRKITVKSVGLMAGTVTCVCADKKITDLFCFIKATPKMMEEIKKIVNEEKQAQKKKEESKDEKA